MPQRREEDDEQDDTIMGSPAWASPTPPRDLDRPYGAPDPMPPYVKPRTDVPPVGALSAEALVKDFEKTAQNIDRMGVELAGTARHCADELAELVSKFKAMEEDVRATIDHIKEVAAAFRDEAKTVFVRVENTALMTQDVREMADRMRDRLLGKMPVASQLPVVNLVEGELDRLRSEQHDE